jgi:hypothetical protein
MVDFPTPRRRATRLALAALLLLAVVGISALVWLATPAALLPEAAAALTSTPAITYRLDDAGRMVFAPTGSPPTTGLILYPGGRVPPEAYAPAAARIAEQGHRVVIVPMPLNLAVLGADRAAAVQAAYPEIRHWAIGGHSLGGAMACRFASRHPGAVEGLVLWGSYCADDVSAQDIAAVSVFGSLDGGRGRIRSAESAALLPPEVRFVEIEGGNHEQLASYTGQPNDPPAAISRTDQQTQAVAATVELLEAMELEARDP